MSTTRTTILTPDFDKLGPSTVRNTHAFRLRSEAIGQDFLIEVSLPPMPTPAGETVPVVYVLDGNDGFAMTAQIARALQWGPFPLPQALIVGVGYHVAEGDGLRSGLLRMRDLTPWPDEALEARFKAAPPPWTMPADLSFGGAPAFLEFIEAEVKPFVADRFPVDETDQTLLGMSAGGLTVLYSLFSQPGRFQRYVAASPALYWAGGRVFDLEAELAARVRDLPARLFLSVGGLEEIHDADSALVSNLYRLESRLRGRAYPGLDMTLQVFEGETHMSVYPAAVSRGLSTVFGGPRDIHDWSRRLSA